MPGIYVRKAKWIHWIQEQDNPGLTVPGSYWLCHKSNIYKFIFRYHRTTRNLDKFNYGRDLMKIIRRIIKNQPHQGQQFGTNHLLVTYNHTSWTRQDKAFAMMKFKERSVVAFSHAFVLTIKVLFSVESEEQNANYVARFSFPQESTAQSAEEITHIHTNKKKGEKENKCLTHSSRSDFSEKHFNVKDEVVVPDSRIQLDNNWIVNNLTKTSSNEQSVKDALNCKDISRVTKVSKISEMAVMQDVTSENSKNFNNKEKEKLKKENRNQSPNNKNATLLNSSVYGSDENEVISNESINCLKKESIKNNYITHGEMNTNYTKLSSNSDRLFEVNEHTTENDFTEYKSISNTKKLLKNNVVDTNIDSINLPYQYLMEKEVEDAKQKILDNDEIKNNMLSCNSFEQRPIKHKLDEINKKHSTDSAELFTSTVKAKDIPSPKKRKLSSDNIASRSSDITDLVMEGLMFTIRQEQDTVAVIEQKTKLEIDEVLENSEEIETTKGEKCLRNSSLLGLENLITMIELSNETETTNKCQSTIIRESILENQSTNKLLLPTDNGIKQQNDRPYLKYIQWESNTRAAAGTSFTNNNEDPETYNDEHEYEKDMKLEDPEYEEEEEDIVPEALQDEMFQSSISSFQDRDQPSDKLKDMANKDLLMDVDESYKSETLNPLLSKLNLLSKVRLKMHRSDNSAFTKSHKMSVKSAVNRTHKYSSSHRSNVPIIVSNEIITTDQIPLPLQRMFKNKLQTNAFTSNRGEANNGSNETFEQQSCQEKNISFNGGLEDHTLNDNMLQSTQYLENSRTPMHSISETHNESTLLKMSDMELKNLNTTNCNLELDKEELQKENVTTNKEEQSLPNKMQDITHEFCQELSCLQKKKDAVDQKCLRSKMCSKDAADSETRIEMMKFFHDITRGAKVVVKRMSTKSIHRILGKSSSLATCMPY